MSEQFLTNYLSVARNLYKRLGKIFEKQTPQCFISRLDPDVILDDLIPYLDIKNILNLRKVCIHLCLVIAWSQLNRSCVGQPIFLHVNP